MSSRHFFVHLDVFSKRTKTLESARSTFVQKFTTTHKAAYLAGVMLPAVRVRCSFSPFFLFGPSMRRLGVFREQRSSWHLQVACLRLEPWTSVSASFVCIVQLFLVCERSGRRKPRSEAHVVWSVYIAGTSYTGSHLRPRMDR